MKPLILLSPDYAINPGNGRVYNFVKKSYSLVLAGAGAAPFMALNARLCDEYSEMMDGLILCDSILYINPGRYNKSFDPQLVPVMQTIPQNPSKDSMDILLCEAFLKANKPILGIGRGMHVINTVFGGDLKQVLEEPVQKVHNSFEYHGVSIDESSKLFTVLGAKASVLSCHGQAVGKLGDGLKVSAVSGDGITEAFEHETLPVFGVQWHPEVAATQDLEMHAVHKNADAPADPPSDELTAIRKRQYTHKTAVPEFKNGCGLLRPADNALFNAFTDLCKERSGKNE